MRLKKYLSLVLTAALLIAMFAACGDSAGGAASASAEAVSSTEASEAEASEAPAATETAAPIETTAAAASASEAETNEEVQQFDGTLVETSYFSFVYGDDWTYDPENDLSEYSEGCSVSPQVPDPDSDWDQVYVIIEVEQNNPTDFSATMYRRDLNSEQAVTGENDYSTRNIGGVDCWVADDGDDTYFLGYMPDVDAFISIYVSEDDQWDYVDPLLDSISFNVPAYEDEVIPWYWESEPYTVAEHNTMVGALTVNSKQLPMDQVNPTYNIFDARIQVVGNDYYILDNGLLRKYTRDGDQLIYNSDIALPYEPDEFAVDSDGTIYLSAFGKSMTKLQDGTEIMISSDTKTVAMHPSCTWGISYFTNSEVAKINLTDGAITNYTLDGIKVISHLMVTENYIVLSCTLDNEDSTACLKVYDTEFNELMTLDKTGTNSGYYGSVSAVTETANGLIVFDGNLRDVYFLDTNLQLITAVDMSDLMGTDYPWPCQAVTTEDGSVIVICTDNRADYSCDEAIVFQLTGF